MAGVPPGEGGCSSGWPCPPAAWLEAELGTKHVHTSNLIPPPFCKQAHVCLGWYRAIDHDRTLAHCPVGMQVPPPPLLFSRPLIAP